MDLNQNMEMINKIIRQTKLETQNLPEETVNMIFTDLKSLSVFRKYSSNILVKRGDMHRYLLNNQDETQWNYQPKISNHRENDFLDIQLHRLSNKIYISRDALEEDKINFDSWLYHKTQINLIWAENRAFLHGNGKREPLGLLYDPQNVKTIKLEDISKIADTMLNAITLLPQIYRYGARWLVSKNTYQILLQKFADRISYLSSQDHMNQMYFLGYPIMVLEELEGKYCIFGNLQAAYCIVDHTEIRLIPDQVVYKPNYELFFERKVGGAPININAYVIITVPAE